MKISKIFSHQYFRWIIPGFSCFFSFDFEKKVFEGIDMNEQSVGGVLFEYNGKVVNYGIPSIYSTKSSIIKVPFSNLLTVHNLETLEVERQNIGNIRASFAPIVRKDHIVFIGGIHFPIRQETNYCTEITKIIIESRKNDRDLNKLFSDVTLIINEKEYHLHRFILFPILHIIPNLLSDETIKIKDEHHIFENIIEYLYDRDDKVRLKTVMYKGVLISSLKIDKNKSKMELYKYPQISDCIIETSDSKWFVCHKLFLCYYSEYFHLLFTGNYNDSKQKEVKLDIDSSLFKHFYNFIYMDKVHATSVEHIFELLEFSQFLISKFYERSLLDLLESIVNNENAMSVLLNLKERNFNHPSVKRKCTEIIKETVPYENLLDILVDVTLKHQETDSLFNTSSEISSSDENPTKKKKKDE